MTQSLTVDSNSQIKASTDMVQHVFAVDTIKVTNKVKLRLKLDPADGRVIRRDVDVEVNWDEINALEARMLASRES